MNKIIPISIIGILILSGFEIVAGIITNNPCLDPPYGPTKGYTGIEYTFCFVIPVDPNGDEYFTHWNWGDGTDSGWVGPYASGQTTSASHTWTDEGVYEIRVKLKNTNGTESNWSEPHIITIYESGPPNPPIIHGPHYGKTNTNYSFSIGAITDPNGDQFYGFWDWGDSYSEWIGPFNPGETTVASHVWSEPGNYTIRVRLRDIWGAESSWSDPFFIEIVKLKPRFFLGTFKPFNQTEDLIILHVRTCIVFPSFPIINKGGIFVLSKDFHGYLGASFTFGAGGVAII